MFLIILLTVLIAIITTFLWHLKYKHLYRHTKNIPGPPTYPFLGNALDFGQNPVDFLKCICKTLDTYGPISKLWVGSNKVYIVVSDPDLSEFLLSSPKYLTKSIDYKMMRSWLGNGLLISTGSHWQKRRKIITPTFHFKILEEFIPIFNSAGDILVEKLEKEINKEAVNIYPYITAYTLDVICETAMGTPVNAQNDPNNEYCTATRLMSQIIIIRTFSPWKQFDNLFKLSKEYQMEKKCLNILHGFTNSVIQKRRKETLINQNTSNKYEDDIGIKKRIAFLDLLLQSTIDGVPMSDADIAAEVDTFMFEGHDTTSSAISFAMFEISRNSDVQKKMFEELSTIFADDMTRPPSIKDLNDMKYMECVIKETLRLYPSVPYYGRTLEEDIEFKGKIYPKGAMMGIVAFYMHRKSNLFKDAEKFIPERFLESNIKNPFSYVPFSAGPRNCIGQKFAMYELKATLTKIIRNFELLPVSSKYDPILSAEAVLKSDNGVFVKLQKRKLI